MQNQDKWIMVEFNGTMKSILKEKLPEAQKMAEEMYRAALKGGYTKEAAAKEFTLRIMKDEK